MKNKKEIVSLERRTGDLQNMSNFLAPFTKKMLGKKAFAEADVICNWKEIVGEETAAYSTPVRIDFRKGERTNGVLVIETCGGAFALELQLKTKIMLDKVNTFFGYQAVEKIKILQNPQKIIDKKQDIQRDEKKLVTNEEENYIKELSEGLNSSDLSLILERLGKAVLINNKK